MRSKLIWLFALIGIVASFKFFKGMVPEPSEQHIVNLTTWSNYIEPSLLAEFEKKTGIKVNISNYASNEELLAKLQAGASGFDVAMPSDYMVYVMTQLKLIRALDLAQIPRSKELDPKLMKRAYDPTNQYSLPYDWGTTGIAVNRKYYKGEIKGWKSVFDQPALAGKFSLLDDVRETVGAALKYLGKSLNTKDPADLEAAKQVLLRVRKSVKSFTSEPQVALMNGEYEVSHTYSSDALRGRKKSNGDLDYVIPEEGCTQWIDNFVIPAGAVHVKEAHQLIDFLLSAEANVSMVTNVFVAPSNLGSLKFLTKELQNDPRVFPNSVQLQNCEMIEDLGESLALWDRIWTEVKTAR
jgi:spermidine/putrescine transport system substrate-binding protein